MMKLEVLVNGERSGVAFNQWRSFAGIRFINGKEYHSPFIYDYLTLGRAPCEQARACACATCRGEEVGETKAQMEQVRKRLYLKVKRASRLLQDTPDDAREIGGKLTAYAEILEDTFRIEKAIE
jgi:hypothetical protein